MSNAPKIGVSIVRKCLLDLLKPLIFKRGNEYVIGGGDYVPEDFIETSGVSDGRVRELVAVLDGSKIYEYPAKEEIEGILAWGVKKSAAITNYLDELERLSTMEASKNVTSSKVLRSDGSINAESALFQIATELKRLNDNLETPKTPINVTVTPP